MPPLSTARWILEKRQVIWKRACWCLSFIIMAENRFVLTTVPSWIEHGIDGYPTVYMHIDRNREQVIKEMTSQVRQIFIRN